MPMCIILLLLRCGLVHNEQRSSRGRDSRDLELLSLRMNLILFTYLSSQNSF